MPETYTTTDFGVAAALETYGIELLRFEKKMDERNWMQVFFVFPSKASVPAGDYFSGRLPVDAQSFYMRVRSLKTRLNDFKNAN